MTEQKISSAYTSVNSKKVPAGFCKIRWAALPQPFVLLDYGCGRYINHVKKFVEKKGGVYHGYDPYWVDEKDNETALSCNPDIIVCNNVLNVIQEDEIIEHILELLLSYGKPMVIKIYEGDGSGVGKVTPNGYQRNQKTSSYAIPGKISRHDSVLTNNISYII